MIRPLDAPALRRRVLAATPRGRYRLPAAEAMRALLLEASAGLTARAVERLAGISGVKTPAGAERPERHPL